MMGKHNKFSSLLAALSIIVALTHPGPVFAGGKEKYDQGIKLHDSGQFGAAIDLYTQAINAGDLDLKTLADAYYSRGLAHGRLRKDELALADYKQTLEFAPNHVPALSSVCYQLQRSSKYEEARGYCDRALDVQPDHAPTVGIRALINWNTDHISAATEDFDRAVQLDPDNFMNKANRAFFLDDVGQTERAKSDLESIFRSGPDWLKRNSRIQELAQKYGVAQ